MAQQILLEQIIYIILGLLLIYVIYKKFYKISKKQKFVYSAECTNCLAWNHRDIRPKCEGACKDKFGKNYFYNLIWKRKRNFKDIVCGCSKIE